MRVTDLHESSNDSLEVVLKRLKAHPDIKPIFRKGFDSVGWSDDYKNSDHRAIDRAFRDIVLHSTEGAALFKEMTGELLSRRPDYMKDPDGSRAFLQDVLRFAKEASKRVRGSAKLDAYAKKDLLRWVEGNGIAYSLSQPTQNALLAIPDARPTTNTILYRGILLKDFQFVDQLSNVEKRGNAWQDAIDRGVRVMNHTLSRPSSWTTHEKTAEKFARFSSAGSEYTAMLSALQRKGEIDGRLGIIIATLARPTDIICDMSKIDIGFHQHSDEAEMIIKSGNYRVRIVKAWTKEGPIDLG